MGNYVLIYDCIIFFILTVYLFFVSRPEQSFDPGERGVKIKRNKFKWLFIRFLI